MPKFLIENLSRQRWKTYDDLSKKTRIAADILYERNLTYSKELYVILAGLEVVVRNSFNRNLENHFGKEDWMSDINLFRRSHKEQLNKSIDKLAQNKKGNYTIPDLIAELNFGFWVHLVDAPYEQTFWVPSLRHSFPHKFGKPVRQDIESRLKNLLRLRNKIAHLEPIIRFEPQLMQAYQNTYDVLSWICPETAQWFDSRNGFRAVWQNNNQQGS